MLKLSAEKAIKDIRRATRKRYGAEKKIRIVLEGLRGEEPISVLCRRQGIGKPVLQLVDLPHSFFAERHATSGFTPM